MKQFLPIEDEYILNNNISLLYKFSDQHDREWNLWVRKCKKCVTPPLNAGLQTSLYVYN
jgi:hypothetical protein